MHETKYHTINGDLYHVHIEDIEGEENVYTYDIYCGAHIDRDFAYGTLEDAEKTAEGRCREIADVVAKIRKGENIPTEELRNVFYSQATAAPLWADELMELVADKPKRKWLLGKLNGMLNVAELLDEFERYIKD